MGSADVQDLSDIAAELVSLRNEMPKMRELLESQVKLLSAMNARAAVSDRSLRELPQVGADVSSVWTALKKSAFDIITPKIERWKGGLDALLVFIGLFTAIVTAFFVESSKNLRVNEAKRTNDLLVNLTDIILILNKANHTTLNFPFSQDFVPEAHDVRTNVFWAITLVFTISIAALSVVCRFFLTSLLHKRTTNSCQAVTELWTRWLTAKDRLAPLLDLIPQLMIIPTILFIVGFLDNLYSLYHESPHHSPLVLMAFGIGCMLALAAFVAVAFCAVHGMLYPAQSPFQTKFSKLASHIRKPNSDTGENGRLSLDSLVAFHDIVCATQDDALLDQACTAIHRIAQDTSENMEDSGIKRSTMLNQRLSCTSGIIDRLLSLEASPSCNLTVAAIIPLFSHSRGLQALFSSRVMTEKIFRRILHLLTRLSERGEWQPDTSFSARILRAFEMVFHAYYPSFKGQVKAEVPCLERLVLDTPSDPTGNTCRGRALRLLWLTSCVRPQKHLGTDMLQVRRIACASLSGQGRNETGNDHPGLCWNRDLPPLKLDAREIVPFLQLVIDLLDPLSDSGNELPADIAELHYCLAYHAASYEDDTYPCKLEQFVTSILCLMHREGSFNYLDLEHISASFQQSSIDAHRILPFCSSIKTRTSRMLAFIFLAEVLNISFMKCHRPSSTLFKLFLLLNLSIARLALVACDEDTREIIGVPLLTRMMEVTMKCTRSCAAMTCKPLNFVIEACINVLIRGRSSNTSTDKIMFSSRALDLSPSCRLYENIEKCLPGNLIAEFGGMKPVVGPLADGWVREYEFHEPNIQPLKLRRIHVFDQVLDSRYIIDPHDSAIIRSHANNIPSEAFRELTDHSEDFYPDELVPSR